jgi:hypothetical protein
MGKKIIKISLAKLTQNGAYTYPWVEMLRGEATFTPTFNTCYFQGRTFKKIKGGEKGGNYEGVEDGEIYRIWQH